MRRKPNVLVYVLLVLGAIMIIFPMYLTIISAFKPMDELTKSIFAWPSSFYLGNFKEVITKEGFLHSVINTVFITVVACVGVVLVVPLVSYAIARNMDQKKYYKFLYFFLLIGIFVPFQVKMMPLVQVMSNFHMLNVSGITVVYIASSVCVCCIYSGCSGRTGRICLYGWGRSAVYVWKNYFPAVKTDDSDSTYHGWSVVLE